LLVLALLVFVQAAFNLIPLFSPQDTSQIVLLFTLSTIVFLVLIIFGFVLARSLFKLWVERGTASPGAKFKTRLILSLIGLTLIPATFLFLFAFGLVNRSIDKWFSLPVVEVFQTTDSITADWASEHEAAARGILSQVANHPPTDLRQTAADFRLGAIATFNTDGQILEQSSTSEEDLLLLREQLAVHGFPEAPTITRVGGLLVGVTALEGQGPPTAVAAIFHAPEPFEEWIAAVASQRNNYNELLENRKFYRNTYVQILVLMTILVLFAAVWTGLYLSKRITIPIEALSGATREISAGNLDYRVHVQADDELGMLARLFNDMAGKLQLTSEELDERRRYTETILESIPTGVVSIDDEYNVTKINRAARTLFSVEHPESLDDLFTTEDLNQIGRLLQTCQQEGTSTQEMTLTAEDRPVHSAVIASPLTTGGFVLVVEDLTEVVKAQKATAWREVARRLTHEIKNPLTPIQLSAERISRNMDRLSHVDDRTTGVIRECVDSIIGEVDSLKELVDEFGRAARLPTISPRPTAIKELVDRTLALYEDRLNGTTVTAQIPDDLPLVSIDPRQIKRVLINLIDNALEAMSGIEEKKLTIACGVAENAELLELRVTDSGRGVAPEDRDRIFTPYFSTRKEGTGLGLAIASRIIADHGGHISTESNGSFGARFVIELPLAARDRNLQDRVTNAVLPDARHRS